MRLPASWLSDYVSISPNVQELAGRLTMSGSEVESIHGDVLELAITPNRGDCLSVTGIAREVAALTGRSVAWPSTAVEETGPAIEPLARVSIASPGLCPRYGARLLLDVRVAESPGWMQERLLACDVRPINVLVDITNYVMLELGQPLHAFDFDLLRGHEIRVRTAAPGERMRTLDGVNRALSAETLVIADAERPVAIAGIMGGEATEVTERTTRILLESAHFDASSIRASSKRLSLSTAASYRFERFVDPELVVRALNRAAALFRELAGATVAKGLIDVYPRPAETRTLQLRAERCRQILGFHVDAAAMATALRALGLDARPVAATAGAGEAVGVTVPTFRPDLRGEEDLAEEVGRIVGFDLIPSVLPAEALTGSVSPGQALLERARQPLARSGLDECVTHSLTDPASVRRFYAGEACRLRNPLSEEFSLLRPSLVPQLAAVAARNARHGVACVSVFEVGSVYAREEGRIRERPVAAGLLMGHRMAGHWNLKPVPLEADFFAAKGTAEALLAAFGAGAGSPRPASFRAATLPGLHPGRTAMIELGGEQLGIVGEIHPEAVEALGLPSRVAVFELELERLASHQSAIPYQAVSRYPAVTRDLSMLVPLEVPEADVEAAIRRAGGPLLESVRFFDLYAGPSLPPGTHSLAFALTFRSYDGTLTDADADAVLAQVRQALAGEVGARER